jgi:hypothetical protein
VIARLIARLRIVASSCAIVCATWEGPAFSQSDVAKSPEETRTVVLLEGASQGEAASLFRAVRDHLGDLGVRVVAARPADAPAGLVATVRAARDAATRERAECTLWVDLPRPGEIVLYMLEPRTPHLWTRKLRARDETPAAAIERVGLIARWAVAALIEGQQVEMDSDPETAAFAAVEARPPVVERPPPPRATVVPASRATSGSLGAAYSGSTFSANTPWESGVALSLRWRWLGGLFAGAAYRFLLPVDVESPIATARVSRHPAELSVGYLSGKGPYAWFAEAGAILDYTVRSTTAVALAYQAEPASGRASFGVSPRLGATWLAAPRIWVTAAAGLDVFFSNSRYIVDGASQEAKPWAARPRGDIGMAADLW